MDCEVITSNAVMTRLKAPIMAAIGEPSGAQYAWGNVHIDHLLPCDHSAVRYAWENHIDHLLPRDHRFLSDLGVLTAAELTLVRHHTFAFREHAVRKQAVIQRELAEARWARDYATIRRCLNELRSLNRKFWNLASVIKAKVLVGRKGTQRSRSKSGCQTLCTHTISIFESDTATRWLIGLLPKVSRAVRVSRNEVNRNVPESARAQTLSGTPSFEPRAV
ncbi:MAG: hypothetical protein QOF24_1512 [Verrucomicrobiota bacterium]|jgi:hypothetical protein